MAGSTNRSNNSSYKWKFCRLGGFDQVRIETGADILALEHLDQKLWAALSCPTHGLEFDVKTLELIDSDGDGRIRVPEIIAAVQWTRSMLKDLDGLTGAPAELPLSAIDDSHEEGMRLLSSARQILANLGKPESPVIAPEDTLDTLKIFSRTKFNGDGIIPSESAEDDETRQVIEDIINCLGPEQDRGGLPGISREKLDRFFTDLQAFSEWWEKAENDGGSILTFGEATDAAEAIFVKVRPKIDDYFTRCRLAEFDSSASPMLNPSLDDYRMISTGDLSPSSDKIATFPLAAIGSGKPLPLVEGINPAWVDPISRFRSEIVTPVLGELDGLSSSDWAALCSRFAAYESWLADRPATSVDSLGIERIRQILSGNAKETIHALLDKDQALEPEVNAIASVDRLIRYYCSLHRLLNNFVSFRDFYTRGKKGIFQVGTLYIDARSCDLCVKIDDIAKHSSVANLSHTYIAYCDCTRRSSNEKMTIAAAVTDGDSDNLLVGRNGVFYDLQGRDWDATIVKIIDQPISIRQAFWSPYKRAARMVGEQIGKIAGAREKQVTDSVGSGIAQTGAKVDAGKAPVEQPFDVGKFAGIFAAIGLAVGAIGTAIASVVTGFVSLKWWQMPLALLGLILIVSGPSMVITAFNLRKRNLGPILDANGWAVNTRALINIPFGTSLTAVAKLPEGSERSLSDPFAEKKRPWKLYVALLVLLAAVVILWLNGLPLPSRQQAG